MMFNNTRINSSEVVLVRSAYLNLGKKSKEKERAKKIWHVLGDLIINHDGSERTIEIQIRNGKY